MANPPDVRQPDTPFDLTILYMEDARSWCEYLFDIFQPYEVYQNSEEITTFPTHETTLNNIKESRVVIVIVSPVFLDNCSPMLEDYTEQVVALLCGVEVTDLEAIEESVPSYKNWKVVEAMSGQRNITQVTLKMLDGMDSEGEGEEGNEYSPMPTTVPEEPEDTYLTMTGNLNRQEDTDDTYLTMHGGRIEEAGGDYITMTGTRREEVPEDVYESMVGNVEQDDTYEIMTGTKPGKVRMPPRPGAHQFERKNPGYINTPQEKPQYSMDIYITPSTIKTGSKEPLFIIFTNLKVSTRPEDMYKALFKSASMTSNVVAIVVNQSTLRINSLPEGLVSGLITVEVLHNSKSIATLALKVAGPMDVMSELLDTITNPLQFMCESLGISPADSNTLDNILYEHAQRHLPPEGFSKFFLTTQQTQEEMAAPNEMPTVLHFAAKYGLKNMCTMLLNFPGAYQAMSMKNCNGDTPSVLAAKNGDESLKEYLESWLEFSGEEVGQHSDTSYVHMTGNVSSTNPDYINKFGRSDYDRPFPVPIPAASTLMRDDTIISLVSGSEDDIYDYYDNKTASFRRHEDDDDDDDDDAGEDYEHVEDNRDVPPSRMPPDPESKDEEVMGKVNIMSVEELEKTPRTMHPDAGVPESQQALIDLQNRVKRNEISLDEAVSSFKELELGRRKEQFSFKMQSAAMKKKKDKDKSGFPFFRRRDEKSPTSPKPGGTSVKLGVTSLPPPPTSPKPGKPGGRPSSPNVKASSKSVGVPSGRGFQMQDRFVEGIPSPSMSPQQGRATEKFIHQEELRNPPRPISTTSISTIATRTLSASNPLASLATAASSCTLPIVSHDDTKQGIAGAGSRNSTLSTGSRDSSYGSATEPDPDQEPDQPPPPPPSVPLRPGSRGHGASDRKNNKAPEPRRTRAATDHSVILGDLPQRDAPPPPSIFEESEDYDIIEPLPSSRLTQRHGSVQLPTNVMEQFKCLSSSRESVRRSSDPAPQPLVSSPPPVSGRPKPQPRPRRPPQQ